MAEPLKDAVERLGAKTPVGSVLRSREWAQMPLALRERGQFSAGVASVKLMQSIQDRLMGEVSQAREQLANGKEAVFDRSSFIDAIRQVAIDDGVETIEKETERGGLKDIRSISRLGLIYDQQKRQAAGHARWKLDQTEGALLLWPAQEFVRVEGRRVPRQDWPERWVRACGKAGDAKALSAYGASGRMIALKTSGVWAALSIFGTPWEPFDWGSGMGIEDVDRETAVQLGLMQDDQVLESGEEAFNAQLKASVTNLKPSMKGALFKFFGDQVKLVGDELRWTGTSAQPPSSLPRQPYNPEMGTDGTPIDPTL